MNEELSKPLPGRVMVAEDEHLVATGIRSQLLSLGCQVVGPVADGRSALEIAETETPDFAMLDVRMPVLDGLDAARTLWQDMGIPSVILTAYSDPRSIERAQQTGVFGYLLKPATADMLRAGLSVAWARANAARGQAKRIEQLEKLMANRRLIEQAKWKLVESRSMTEPQAHLFLQTEARNHRRRLIDVACGLLGVPVPSDGPANAGGRAET